MGCASSSSSSSSASTLPGNSIADKSLQGDTRKAIGQYERTREVNGEQGVAAAGGPKIVATKVTKPPTALMTGSWEETWTVQRSGYTVDYLVTYTPRADIGGTDLRVHAVNMPPPRTAAVATPPANLTQPPPGIPANAQLFFAGQPGHTTGPPAQSGTFYLYDDTARRIVQSAAVSPQHPDLPQNVKYDMSHTYRGLFAPGQ